MRRIAITLAILALFAGLLILDRANADTTYFTDNTGSESKTYTNVSIPSGAAMVVGGWQISAASDSRLNGQLVLNALAGPATVTVTITDGLIRVMDYEEARAEYCRDSKGANYAFRDFAGFGSPCTAPVSAGSIGTGKGNSRVVHFTPSAGQYLVIGGFQIENATDSRLNGQLVIADLAGPTDVTFVLTDGFATLSDKFGAGRDMCAEMRATHYNQVVDLGNLGDPCVIAAWTPTPIPTRTDLPDFNVLSSILIDATMRGCPTCVRSDFDTFVYTPIILGGEQVYGIQIIPPACRTFTSIPSEIQYDNQAGGSPNGTGPATNVQICSRTIFYWPSHLIPHRTLLPRVQRDPPSYGVPYYEPTGEGVTKDFDGMVPVGAVLIAGGGVTKDLSGQAPQLNSDQSVLIAVRGPFLWQVRIVSGFIQVVPDTDGKAEFCKRGDQAFRSGHPYQRYYEFAGFQPNPCSS